jgi:hypothetical protein
MWLPVEPSSDCCLSYVGAKFLLGATGSKLDVVDTDGIIRFITLSWRPQNPTTSVALNRCKFVQGEGQCVVFSFPIFGTMALSDVSEVLHVIRECVKLRVLTP